MTMTPVASPVGETLNIDAVEKMATALLDMGSVADPQMRKCAAFMLVNLVALSRRSLGEAESGGEAEAVEYGKALNEIRRKAIALSQRCTDGYAEIQSIAVDALNIAFTASLAPRSALYASQAEPLQVTDEMVEAVKSLENACNQARLALDGMVSVQSAIDVLDTRQLGVSAALQALQPKGE